jgi:hypothetical protein
MDAITFLYEWMLRSAGFQVSVFFVLVPIMCVFFLINSNLLRLLLVILMLVILIFIFQTPLGRELLNFF